MPRYGPFIHQVYIADGFADDCDELIHRCLNEEKLDYHVFCKIWKAMKMGCMYEGRTLGAEIAELSEEVIHVGKHYMLKDTANFEESVVGVFLVYALLELQPYKGFAHLRIVPEDLPAINRIERVARRDKRYDVLYALGSILIKGPVEYHITEREYGMEISIRKYLEGFTSIDKLGVRPKGVYRRQNEELDVLKDIHVLTQKYTQYKMMISERAQFDRNLRYINPNFPKEMEGSLMKLITGVQEREYGRTSDSDDCDKISKSRRTIKEKAMKQEIKPVRHMVNLENRKPSTSTRDCPTIEDATQTSTKTKKEDAKKKIKSDRKRRIPISPRAIKRNRNIGLKVRLESSSEYDESDTDLKVILKKSEYVDDVPATTSGKIAKTIIDTKNQRKGKKAVVKSEEGDVQEIQIVKDLLENKEKMKKAGKEMQKVIEIEDDSNGQELNIEIDTLPVLIRTEEQGKLFEIEIIDQQTSKKPVAKVAKPKVRTYKKKETALQKISSIPDVTIAKITATEVIEPVASTSSANQFATLIEIGAESGKKEGEATRTVLDKQGLGIMNSKLIEKRDCKRVHLQSKFKRLGMLPVANFRAPEDIILEVNNESEETDELSTNSETQMSGNISLEPIEDE